MICTMVEALFLCNAITLYQSEAASLGGHSDLMLEVPPQGRRWGHREGYAGGDGREKKVKLQESFLQSDDMNI